MRSILLSAAVALAVTALLPASLLASAETTEGEGGGVIL